MTARPNRSWTPERIAQLKALLALPQPPTHVVMAAQMGLTTAQVASGIRRHIHGHKTPLTGPTQRLPENSWTEKKLTEPWAAYTARKQAERAASRWAVAA